MNARREAKYRKIIRLGETPTKNVLRSGVLIGFGLLGFWIAFSEAAGFNAKVRMRLQRVEDAFALERRHTISTGLREYFKDHSAVLFYQAVRDKFK